MSYNDTTQPQNKARDEGATVSTTSENSQASTPPGSSASMNPVNVTNKKQIMEMFRTSKEPSGRQSGNHAFWDTQPVPKLTDELTDIVIGSVDAKKAVEDVRQKPYYLPSPFVWVTVDVTDEGELCETYKLLSENYVEDDDNMFRFDYSKEFLQWALSPPGYNPDWHIGVKTDKGKLVAFITGIPARISVYGEQIQMAEINFLCVHKKLRSKRLAPLLIKEVTRRINLTGIWQAVYTAGILLTKPVTEATYYHRNINIKKLVEVRFTGLRPRTTMSMAQKLYKLPEETQISGLRLMEKKDIPEVLDLLRQEFERSSLIYPLYSIEEAEHTLLPRDKVVSSYVREIDGKVTDFFSFYILPSSVIGNEKHETVFAAYSFYYAASTVSTVTLLRDALIVAANLNMDVFNALNLGRNKEFIEELKFGRGDGSLRYYLYNYLCPSMEPSQMGLIML